MLRLTSLSVLSGEPMTSQPSSAVSHPLGTIYPSVNASGMDRIATQISERNEALREVTGTGVDRVFRSFRTAEVKEVTGLSDHQIREWRKANREELAAYRAASESGKPDSLMHMPLTLEEIHHLMEHYGVRPRRPDGHRALRIGCMNFKGGSSKTSTTLHLGEYFAIQGWRTLIIDADPQGSLSGMYGFNPEDTDDELTLLPALQSVSNVDAAAPVQLRPIKTHIHGLDIIPSNLEMIGADFEISAAFMNRVPAATEFYECVNRAITTIQDDYDLIFVDGAPAFSFAALATMWAMDGLIVPVPPASPDFKATGAFCSMAASGLGKLAVRAGLPDREWAPFLFLQSRVNAQRTHTNVITALSREVFGRNRIDVSIPDNAAITNAIALNQSIWSVSASDVEARSLKIARTAYTSACKEILMAINESWRKDSAAAQEAS